jgi:hypothetical protein
MRTALNLLLFSLFLALSGPVLGASRTGTVTQDGVSFRSGPGLEHSVLQYLGKGTQVTVVETQGNWSLVRTADNQVGWTETSVLTISEGPPPTVSGAPPEPPPPPPQAEPSPQDKLALHKEGREFYEISLMIRPAFDMAFRHPASMDDSGFSIGAHVAWFILPKLGLSLPYTYRTYSSAWDFHTVGGGPVYRYLDWKFMRGTADANFLYARGGGDNNFGWSVGWDLTFGFPEAKLRPFFGPFVRYETIYLDGPDVSSLSLGAGITLTGFTDFH